MPICSFASVISATRFSYFAIASLYSSIVVGEETPSSVCCRRLTAAFDDPHETNIKINNNKLAVIRIFFIATSIFESFVYYINIY